MNVEIPNDEKLVLVLATPTPRRRSSGFWGSNQRRKSIGRKKSGMNFHSRENIYIRIFV